MTQVATARLLGKTQSYISKMESGQRRVDTCQLIEFAQIYRKDLSFFLPI
ncbi:MAG: helix-turn-helix transcriptional regulator [Candidatus Aminicenantes bacterium]|nr:helix-turn-helix transcriptional regulator [Candidatus Aminicenantes bacterium]